MSCNLPPVLGLAELAHGLDMTKYGATLRSRQPDFPEPLARLASGPVWAREDILEYARRRDAIYHERAAIQRLAEEPA